ncbi:MAG: nucleotidyltransferase family protein [Acidobacteriota bacterium]
MQRPEHRILLACLWVGNDAGRRDEILTCLRNPIDWGYLLGKAAVGGITSLLRWHLNAICPDSMPTRLQAHLYRRFLDRAAQNLRLTAELLEVLQLLGKEGIEAVPLGGPLLAHTLYPHPTLRQFDDLDILVRREEVFRAIRVLAEGGYGPQPDYSAAIERMVLRNDRCFALGKADGTTRLDLHWELLPRSWQVPLPVDAWWRRLRTVALGQRRVPTLRPEDLLVALSVHGFEGMWRSLAWIEDVARLLDRHRCLDWDELWCSCEHPKLARILFVALTVAHRLAGARLPQKVLWWTELDGEVEALAEEVSRRLFEDLGRGGDSDVKAFHARLESGRMARFPVWLSSVSTPTIADLGLRLPRPLLPAYRLWRPLRLLLGIGGRDSRGGAGRRRPGSSADAPFPYRTALDRVKRPFGVAELDNAFSENKAEKVQDQVKTPSP